MIMGVLLWIGQAVNNIMLVTLSAIGSQQAAVTEDTMAAVDQLLDYCATYPDNGITYRPSNMVLAARSDAGFDNKSRSRTRADAHIFLLENDAIPRWNGPLLTIAQIMKYVWYRQQLRQK